MIQDIGTLRFHNEYKKQDPEEKSRILCYRNGEALVRESGNGQITFPTYRELQAKGTDEAKTDIYEFTYLFRIDEGGLFSDTGRSSEQISGGICLETSFCFPKRSAERCCVCRYYRLSALAVV